MRTCTVLTLLCLLGFALCDAAQRVRDTPKPSPGANNKAFEQQALVESDLQLQIQRCQQDEAKWITIRSPAIEMSKYNHTKALLLNQEYQQAIPLLESLALKGNPFALTDLGKLYLLGESVPVDFVKAGEYFTRAADLGNSEAQYLLGYLYNTQKLNRSHKSMGLVYHTFSARSFDRYASIALGYINERGLGVQTSCNTAVHNYRIAALSVLEEVESGIFDLVSPERHVKLEDYIETGDDGWSSKLEILDYVMFSLSEANPDALVEVGDIYLRGKYRIPQNFEKAQEYLNKARLRSTRAKALLGLMYERGLAVEQDLNQAEQLYKQAVQFGDAVAMNLLGELNLHKFPPNYPRALELFRNAAAVGNVEAQVNMGMMLYHGQGTTQDLDRAYHYFRSASSSLSPSLRGLYYFAEMHFYGISVVQDCSLAAAAFKKIVHLSPEIAEKMDSAFAAFQNEDYPRALVEYELLAELGIERAIANVAWMYQNNYQTDEFLAGTENKNVSRMIKTVQYLLRSAELGNPKSYLTLGDLYYYGFADVPPDYSKSFAYYMQIVNANVQARFNVGYMHHFGEGVPKDLFLAKRYYDYTLEGDPNGYLAVYICLGALGLEYSSNLILQGEFSKLWHESLEYFTPLLYDQFLEEWNSVDPEDSNSPATGGNEKHFLDTESMFGYNWDTVLMFTLAVLIITTFLMRLGILHIQL